MIKANHAVHPGLDLVCSETWFGDRTKRPCESADFIRDVFVSGRLYDLLLRAKIRGLGLPEQFVALEDRVPMVEFQGAGTWVSEKLKLLEAEGLV